MFFCLFLSFLPRLHSPVISDFDAARKGNLVISGFLTMLFPSPLHPKLLDLFSLHSPEVFSGQPAFFARGFLFLGKILHLKCIK